MFKINQLGLAAHLAQLHLADTRRAIQKVQGRIHMGAAVHRDPDPADLHPRFGGGSSPLREL